MYSLVLLYYEYVKTGDSANPAYNCDYLRPVLCQVHRYRIYHWNIKRIAITNSYNVSIILVDVKFSSFHELRVLRSCRGVKLSSYEWKKVEKGLAGLRYCLIGSEKDRGGCYSIVVKQVFGWCYIEHWWDKYDFYGVRQATVNLSNIWTYYLRYELDELPVFEVRSVFSFCAFAIEGCYWEVSEPDQAFVAVGNGAAPKLNKNAE